METKHSILLVDGLTFLLTARMGVLAETVRTYLEIVNLRHQQRLAGEIVEIFQQRKSLADSLYDRGLIDRRDRINALTIEIPPLRERINDLPLLCSFFVSRYNGMLGKHIEGFANEARQCLEEYNWPGNVRELENVIMQAIFAAEDQAIRDKQQTIRQTGIDALIRLLGYRAIRLAWP